MRSYLPQLHLKQWADANGKIPTWFRVGPQCKLVLRHQAPAATGYLPGLYRIAGVTPDKVQYIDTEVFGRLETRAAPILRTMIGDGPTGLTSDGRFWWTAYVNSLVFRLPQRIGEIASFLEQRMAELPQPAATAVSDATAQSSLLQWARDHDLERLENLPKGVLLKLLSSGELLQRMRDLTWAVLDLSKAPRRLILGDNPVNKLITPQVPEGVVSLPLAPTHLFVGAESQEACERLRDLPPKELVWQANAVSLASAKKYAYGAAAREFIEKHFRR